MSELIEFLTTKEIIIIYILIIAVCLVYSIIYIIDKNNHNRKKKHNTRELNKLVEEVNEQLLLEEKTTNNVETAPINTTAVYVEPVIEKIVEEKAKDPVVDLTEKSTPAIENLEIEKEQTLKTKLDDLLSSYQEIDSIHSTEEPVETKAEELIYTDIEPNQTEAQKELMRLTEELEKASSINQNIDLTSYEEAQEKEAIISLDELLKRSKEMYANNEITQYEDEGNEPISLIDLEKKFAESKELFEQEPVVEVEQPVMIAENVDEQAIQKLQETLSFAKIETNEVAEVKRPTYQAEGKFKSSPVISPIYGIEKSNEFETSLELENTANYEKLDEEIKKTNEFLMTLKELQKNLE